MAIQLEKTKALAKMFNSITKELEAGKSNFKVNAETFCDAKFDFYSELKYNVLNCNFDLIISRLEKCFPDYSTSFSLGDFDDTKAELLSEYGDFSEYLFNELMSCNGLSDVREIAEKEQKKAAAKPKPTQPKMETMESLTYRAIEYGLITDAPQCAENDNGLYDFQIKMTETLNELGFNEWLRANNRDVETSYTFDIFCEWLAHCNIIRRIEHAEQERIKQFYQNIVFDKTATTPKPNELNIIQSANEYRLNINKEREDVVLFNFQFWNELSSKEYKNIFKNITQHRFLEMVCRADFSELNKKGISQRVKYNAFVLSRLLNNDEWGNIAAQNLNTTLVECQKRCEFPEWNLLKKAFLP